MKKNYFKQLFVALLLLCTTLAASAQSYNLKYKVDGKDYATYSLAAGEAIPHPAAPAKDGHTFLGWSTSTNLEQIDIASNADAMLYSNAPCKTDQYGDQFTSWDVLFDGRADTFFHSDYSGADSEDGLDHYLRVDMGEGNSVSIFTFSYTNRNSNCHINAPKTIVVEGSNEADGEYAPIATLTGLPSANSAVYESSLLGNGNDYRYIRFRVTATQQNQMKAGHPFFFISEFEMYQVTPAPVVMPASDLTLYARFRMYNSDIEQDGIFYDIVDEEAHTVEVTTCQSSLDGYSGVLDIPSTVTYNGEEYTVIGAQNGVLNAGSIKSVHIPATFGTVPANMFTGNKTITSVTIGDGITSIGSKAFVGCSALTDVEIPGSVTTIAGEAFADCSVLTSIVIPSSVTSLGAWAFRFCSSLESVEIQGEITTIDSYVFGNCTSLKSITIPSSVTSIGYAAFYACSSLENVEIPASVTTIGEYAFSNCYDITNIDIPNSVTTIGDYAFQACELTDIVIPSSVTSIGTKAFMLCEKLKTVINFSGLTFEAGTTANGYIAAYADRVINAPGGTMVGDYVFTTAGGVNTLAAYLGNATELTLPANYNGENYVIGENAFAGCASIESLTIPAAVTSIGNGAFSGCTALANLTIEDSENPLVLGANTVVGDLVETTLFCDAPLETLYMGRNLEYNRHSTGSTYTSPFQRESTLTSLTIGDKVTEIPWGAFIYCTGLTEVVIPNNVTMIDYYAFLGCSGITNFVMGTSVEYLGDYSLCGCSGLTELVIPEGVSQICRQTLWNCDNLVSISIPASVTTIDDGAFKYCPSLANVRFEDGEEPLALGYNKMAESESETGEGLFYNCPLETLYLGRNLEYQSDNMCGWSPFTLKDEQSLKNVTIGNGVTSIGRAAFCGCSGLTGIEIPNSVTSIGDYAFEGCTGLTSVEIPNSVTTIGCGVFSGCSGLTSIEIPNSVTSIGVYAFVGCSGLTSIEIPSSVTSIGESAFENCSALKTVINFSNQTFTAGSEDNGYVAYYADKVINAPNGTKVGDYVFTTADGVNTLVGYIGYETELVLPENFNGQNYVIGATAFAGEAGIASLTIPAAVTAVETDAFLGCTGLNAVYIDDLAAWCNIDFQGVVNSNPLNNAHNLYVNGELLTELVIPDGITEIKNETFRGCNQITSLTIPEGVTTIGQYAFNTCTALTQVTFPESLTTLRRGAFSGCTALETVVLPAAVTELEYSVFMACTSLVDITSLATTPPAVVWGTLTNIASNATLYVPRDCGAAYAATDWSQVPNIVELAFNLVYKVNGEVYATERIDYGAAVTPIDAPEVLGYTFLGWDGLPDYMPRHDVEVNAVLEKSSDFITLNPTGTTVYTSQYALDFSEVEGLKAYAATGYDTATGEITMTRVKKVNAGIGVYLVGEASTTYAVPYIDYSTTNSLNMLVGVLKKTMVNSYTDDGIYANYRYVKKSGDTQYKFYQAGDGNTVSAGKAYLQIPVAWFGGMASETVGVRFDDGELTDIDEVEGEIGLEDVKTKTVYDLQGRAVENPAHGIYIIDGKKVFIK